MLYPTIRIDADAANVAAMAITWRKYCGHLTDGQFIAARDAHMVGPHGSFPLGIQAILAARAKIAEEEKVLDRILGRTK